MTNVNVPETAPVRVPPAGAGAMRAVPPPPIGQTAPYLAEWERSEPDRGRRQPAWLRARRREARERFAALGFPGTRVEDWRFTNVAPIAEARFALAAAATPSAADLETWTFATAGPRLVFVNGRFEPGLSNIGRLPAGVVVGPLSMALEAAGGAVEAAFGRLTPDAPFPALNTAFVSDAACLIVPPHVVLDTPIQVLFVSVVAETAGMSCPRLLVLAGEDSQTRIVETHTGTPGGAYFTNAVTEIALGAHAIVEHVRIQHDSAAAFHVGLVQVEGQRDSVYTSHAFALGGRLARHEIAAVMAGEGMDCTLNGLYVATDRQLVDNHTSIDHALPHGTSHEIYRGVLGGHARGVFNGKIIVRPDAQKTDAKQTNRALLLSDEALIDTKPQLEIFANDVKCTHGAAVGQLDEDAVFYLRSRGLGAAQARAVLIHAFAGDVLDRVRIEAVQDRLRELLTARIDAELRSQGVRS